MALYVDGTEMKWYDSNVTIDGTNLVGTDGVIKDLYVDGTKVFGLNGFSAVTLLTSVGLAPDSANLETWGNNLSTELTEAAFFSSGYSSYGTDTTYFMYLKPGYWWNTSDGNFYGSAYPGTYVYFYEGRSVTGANTSHNGGTNCYLYRDNGV